MTLSFLERSASNSPATRRASGPMPAPRTLAPTSVGAPIRLNVFMPALLQVSRNAAIVRQPGLARSGYLQAEHGPARAHGRTLDAGDRLAAPGAQRLALQGVQPP